MSVAYQATRDIQRSAVPRLLSKEGRVFAIERSVPGLFDRLSAAANAGFPVVFVDAGKKAIDEAVQRGDTLSSLTKQLQRALNASVARRRISSLLRPN